MVMAYIWTGMVLTAVLFSFWSGAGGVLSQAVLEGAQAGVTLTLSMAGRYAFGPAWDESWSARG